MTGILKDFNFTIAYLGDIIIFSKTPQEHLLHIRMVFKKLKSANLSMKKSKCSFFSKEIQYLGHKLSATGIRPLPAKTHTIQHMKPPTTPKQVRAFLGLVRYYRKFIKGFAKKVKPLTLLTRQQVKFEGTPVHHTTFLHLNEAIVQAPILHYLNPDKKYIVYTDALDNTCRAQLSQEHGGREFPIVFLSHTFTETQWKWSTTEQEAYGIYYAITKWNYYLQGTDIIVRNDHKPLAWFLNGKNANNKVNRWSLEVATYNISFKWISGAKNKAADCLSRLVKHIGTSVNMLTTSSTDGPAFHTRSHTQNTSSSTTSTPDLDTAPQISQEPTTTPKPLTADCLEALLQMQKTDPFCKCISKRLLNDKAPTMNLIPLLMSKDSYTNMSQMLVKSPLLWSFLNLGNIQYSWKLTTNWVTKVIHAHIASSKCQYYWKGMNKDIWKYIANCVLCQWEKANVQQYPL